MAAWCVCGARGVRESAARNARSDQQAPSSAWVWRHGQKGGAARFGRAGAAWGCVRDARCLCMIGVHSQPRAQRQRQRQRQHRQVRAHAHGLSFGHNTWHCQSSRTIVLHDKVPVDGSVGEVGVALHVQHRVAPPPAPCRSTTLSPSSSRRARCGSESDKEIRGFKHVQICFLKARSARMSRLGWPVRHN